MCNDKFTCDVSGNPDVSGDYPMNVTVKTECKPAKKEWKAKFLWDVSTPDMSGAKFYQNVSALAAPSGKDIIIKRNLRLWLLSSNL